MFWWTTQYRLKFAERFLQKKTLQRWHRDGTINVDCFGWLWEHVPELALIEKMPDRNAVLTCLTVFTRLLLRTCSSLSLTAISSISVVSITKITWNGFAAVGIPWRRMLSATIRITTCSTSCCGRIMDTGLSRNHITARTRSKTTRQASITSTSIFQSSLQSSVGNI